MALITLAGIAEAIDNLNINEATLKGKLLKAIHDRLADEQSLERVTAIDPLELIQELWDPASADEVKAKRKNLSSLKSSLNKSLKQGIKDGTNPEGIIISRDNVFIIAEEKKNQLLDKLALSGEDGHSLVDTLATLKQLLSELAATSGQDDAVKILEELDSARQTLSKLADLATEEAPDSRPSPPETAEEGPVEEFEVDDDTIIEFVDEESAPEEESVPPVSPTEKKSNGEPHEGDGDTPLSAEDDWDSFEILDGDLDIIDAEELAHRQPDAETGGEAERDGTGPAGELEDVELLEEDEIQEVAADEAPEADEADQDDLPTQEWQADDAAEDDWDSFEVLDDDLDIVDEEEVADQQDGAEADDGAIQDGAGLADDLEDVKLLEGDEFDEVAADEAAETAEADLDDLAANEPQESDDAAEEWDSFEVLDDDLDIVDEEEVADQQDGAEADDGAIQDGAGLADDLEDVKLLEGDEFDEVTADEAAETAEADLDDLAANEPQESDDAAEEWDSFEVLDDDLDIVDEEEVADQQDGAEADDGAIQDGAGLADDLEDVKLLEGDEFDEVTADEAAETAEADLDDLAANEPQESDDAAEEWDSFEVLDDDLDIVDEEEVADQQDGAEADDGADQGGAGLADDLEDVELLEGDEFDEVTADEAAETAEADLDDLAANEPQESDDAAEEWDSFEVLDDDLDIVDEEEVADQQDGAEADDGADQGGAGLADDLEDVELLEEDEIQEVAADEAPEADEAGQGDLPTQEWQADDAAEEEWDSFEVLDDDLDIIDAEEPTDPQHGSPAPDQQTATAEQAADTPAPLSRSLDLSHYIEADEALAHMPEVLQEQNDAYVQQILERFMPKFIKIPAGIYPVGGAKRRRTDRAAGKVKLATYYIGQLPITNDLFDFFVRETGYETDAERHGHGLVTTGRLQEGLLSKTGRHTLAINKGVITHRVQGADWRHPEGPGSSSQNRGHHPVVQVSRRDALAFAAWAGKRLPTEDEWEAAARGPEGWLFPWGNDSLPLANLENSQHGTTTPVTLFGRESLSPYGLLDMLGNVFEWTSSLYGNRSKGELSILKGGSWATAHMTCADRLIEPVTTWSNTIGFRCAVDA